VHVHVTINHDSSNSGNSSAAATDATIAGTRSGATTTDNVAQQLQCVRRRGARRSVRMALHFALMGCLAFTGELDLFKCCTVQLCFSIEGVQFVGVYSQKCVTASFCYHACCPNQPACLHVVVRAASSGRCTYANAWAVATGCSDVQQTSQSHVQMPARPHDVQLCCTSCRLQAVFG
jgi:hypothetical protein